MLPLVATILAIIGGAFTLDARYQMKQTAAEVREEMNSDRERGDLENQLKIAKLELDYLLTQPQSPQVAARVRYLQDLIAMLEKRLLELPK